MGDQLRYMGTTTVVRDIDFIATLLDGKNSLINFYGMSYGTIMGQYLVNIFPNRVGRVAIDGVIDADTWANNPPYKWLRTFSTSTDSTYRLFAEDCAKAGPSQCALSKKEGESTDEVLDRVEGFINQLYTEPLPVPNATLPGILTNGRVRMFLIEYLASPSVWPSLAAALDRAIQGDGTTILNAWNQKDLVDLERSAVSCNDVKTFAPPSPEEVVDEGLWPVTPPERFLGPWNHTLSNPILIISNTHDPATSITGGQTVHKTLGSSSALLVQDGPGHTSLALSSRCTLAARRAFFANGTLPAEGTVCAIDRQPFPTASSATESSTGADSDVKTLVSTSGDVSESMQRVAKFVHRQRLQTV